MNSKKRPEYQIHVRAEHEGGYGHGGFVRLCRLPDDRPDVDAPTGLLSADPM